MYYFAYGSNMNTLQMKGRCPAAVKMGKAMLPCFKFMINSRGVATIVSANRDVVEGGLYEVTDRCITALDRYEGLGSGFYKRQEIDVLYKGNALTAFCYFAADSREGFARPYYMETILEGAVCFNLSPQYIKKAFEKYRK